MVLRGGAAAAAAWSSSGPRSKVTGAAASASVGRNWEDATGGDSCPLPAAAYTPPMAAGPPGAGGDPPEEAMITPAERRPPLRRPCGRRRRLRPPPLPAWPAPAPSSTSDAAPHRTWEGGREGGQVARVAACTLRGRGGGGESEPGVRGRLGRSAGSRGGMYVWGGGERGVRAEGRSAAGGKPSRQPSRGRHSFSSPVCPLGAGRDHHPLGSGGDHPQDNIVSSRQAAGLLGSSFL